MHLDNLEKGIKNPTIHAESGSNFGYKANNKNFQ